MISWQKILQRFFFSKSCQKWLLNSSISFDIAALLLSLWFVETKSNYNKNKVIIVHVEIQLNIKMKTLIRVLFILLCLNNDNWVVGKVIHGDLWTGDNWQFLARFCFLSLHGKFDYEVQVSYLNLQPFTLGHVYSCLGLVSSYSS